MVLSNYMIVITEEEIFKKFASLKSNFLANHRKVIKSKGVFIPKNKNFRKLTYLKKDYYQGQEVNDEHLVDEVLADDGDGADGGDGADDVDEADDGAGDEANSEDGAGNRNITDNDYDFSDILVVYENEDEFEVIPQGKTFS